MSADGARSECRCSPLALAMACQIHEAEKLCGVARKRQGGDRIVAAGDHTEPAERVLQLGHDGRLNRRRVRCQPGNIDGHKLRRRRGRDDLGPSGR